MGRTRFAAIEAAVARAQRRPLLRSVCVNFAHVARLREGVLHVDRVLGARHRRRDCKTLAAAARRAAKIAAHRIACLANRTGKHQSGSSTHCVKAPSLSNIEPIMLCAFCHMRCDSQRSCQKYSRRCSAIIRCSSGPERHLATVSSCSTRIGWATCNLIAPQPVVPASLDELRSAVRGARAPVRVVGRGHSFTPVAECKAARCCRWPPQPRAGLPRADGGPPRLDHHRRRCHVTMRRPISGSARRRRDPPRTQVHGSNPAPRRARSLAKLPSCPQFTVAGAIATERTALASTQKSRR